MEKVEHIGIAVEDLESANEAYGGLLGKPCYKVEAVESEGVRTSFFKVGPNKIELLEATRADSPIARSLAKRGAGLHHIAFAVRDIKAEMERLRQAGFTLLDEKPKKGADGKWVAFLHPRETHGVLIELCMETR